MSTDINETRTGQDPEHEQAEQEWSSDEAGAAVEDPTAEGYESERGDDERAEGERDGDETESGDTRFGQERNAFVYTTDTGETDDDVDGEQPAESVEALHGLDDADTETAEGGEQSAESVEGLRGLDGTETAEGAEPSESVESDESAESDEPVESGHDGSAAADAEQFPAYGDLAQDPTSVPATDVAGDEQPLAADEAVNADADIAQSNSLEDSAHEDSAQVEGVAKPENLGGRNIGAGADPLVDAEAQQEFLSRWTRIQISFLEDPTAAVESADVLIQEIGAALLSALEQRGGELASAGRAASDTEQQRLALRQYRAYIGVLLPQ